ncbi:MAG TPA: hypothetical protein VIK92_06865, partial [Thermaerobacter sp.]
MFGWRPLRRVGSTLLFLLAVGTAAGSHQPAGGTVVLAGVWASPAIAPVWQAVRPWMQQIEREVAKINEFVVYVLDDTVDHIAGADEQRAVQQARQVWSAVREAMEPLTWPGWVLMDAAGTPLGEAPAAGMPAGPSRAAGGSDLELPVMSRGLTDESTRPDGAQGAAETAGEPVGSRMTDLLAAAGGTPAAADGDGAGRSGEASPTAQNGAREQQERGDAGERGGERGASASREERAGERTRAARSQRDERRATAASASGGGKDGTRRNQEGAGWQEAVASWYGPGFYGRPTASGEIFTGREFTAAHRTLPFGTILRVH